MCTMGALGAPPGPEWRARDPHPIGEPLLYRTCMRILSSVEDSCGQGSQDRSPPRGDSARAISHSSPGTLMFIGGFRPGLRPLGFPFSPAGGMPNAGLCSGFANSPWKKQNESAGKTKKPSRARKECPFSPMEGRRSLLSPSSWPWRDSPRASPRAAPCRHRQSGTTVRRLVSRCPGDAMSPAPRRWSPSTAKPATLASAPSPAYSVADRYCTGGYCTGLMPFCCS